LRLLAKKLTFGFAVNFQYAEWRAVALENDIHGTANAVLNQQVRCPKANITLEILFHQLLKDSSLMLNLLQCHIVFFLIERLTQPQVSAKIARKLGCRGALGGAPCL
jgi:hypothetical protein